MMAMVAIGLVWDWMKWRWANSVVVGGYWCIDGSRKCCGMGGSIVSIHDAIDSILEASFAKVSAIQECQDTDDTGGGAYDAGCHSIGTLYGFTGYGG
jgi:hypothetical protein